MISKHYAIVGDGRLARHFKYYFDINDINYSIFDSKNPLSHYHKILLMIPDDQIFLFLKDYSDISSFIHFSGALSIKGVSSCHPLMTFTYELYEKEFYKKIYMVTEKGKDSLGDIFPFMQNPTFEIDSKDKALYHALLVASGNFTTLLWSLVSEHFNEKLPIPEDALSLYQHKIFENLQSCQSSALTGPFARKDIKTIKKNLNALGGSKIGLVYKSFVDAMEIEL